MVVTGAVATFAHTWEESTASDAVDQIAKLFRRLVLQTVGLRGVGMSVYMMRPHHGQPLVEWRSWRKFREIAFDLVGQQSGVGSVSVFVEDEFRHDGTTESWEVVVVGKDVEPDDLFQCQFVPSECQTAITQPRLERVHILGANVHVEDLLRALGEPAVESCLVVRRESAEQGFVHVDNGLSKYAGMWYADSHSLSIVFTYLSFGEISISSYD